MLWVPARFCRIPPRGGGSELTLGRYSRGESIAGVGGVAGVRLHEKRPEQTAIGIQANVIADEVAARGSALSMSNGPATCASPPNVTPPSLDSVTQ